MPDTLDLVVNVQYHGPKAREFYPGSPRAMDILREDLLTLKLPHPKKEKTLIRALPGGKGECAFMWPAVPTRSVLRRHLSTRIWGQDPEGARQRLLKELSMYEKESLECLEMLTEQLHSCQLSLRESPAGTVMLDPQIITGRTRGRTQTEAQLLLDSMASELKIPKSEPMEPILPEASP
ncbi:hypothetical protein C0995_007116 [Termitomyces sp. Mi166|nr:hypothetical protein C0995_007116 [Termitomyces sp. Mi166\